MNRIMETNDKNNTLKNISFTEFDSLFIQYGWCMTLNEMTHISYTKTGDETSYFDIQIVGNKIRVSVPIRNSPYQFVTMFFDFFNATEYVEQKLKEYDGDENLL